MPRINKETRISIARLDVRFLFNLKLKFLSKRKKSLVAIVELSSFQ